MFFVCLKCICYCWYVCVNGSCMYVCVHEDMYLRTHRSISHVRGDVSEQCVSKRTLTVQLVGRIAKIHSKHNNKNIIIIIIIIIIKIIIIIIIIKQQ